MAIPKAQRPLFKFHSLTWSKCQRCGETIQQEEEIVLDYVTDLRYCLGCGEDVAEEEGREIKSRE